MVQPNATSGTPTHAEHPAATALGHNAEDAPPTRSHEAHRESDLDQPARPVRDREHADTNDGPPPRIAYGNDLPTTADKVGGRDEPTLVPSQRPRKPTRGENQSHDEASVSEIRGWADQAADAAPKPTAEQLQLEKHKYEARQTEVRSNYEKAMSGIIEPPAGVSKERLRLAVEGDPLTGQRVPLTFKDAAQLSEFQADLTSVLSAQGIDDATIQQLGSGTTGWRGNPNKEIAAWKPTSDTDFAIFSDQALTQAREHGVPVNQKITQGGRYTVLKNDVLGGDGFYDTPVGKELEALARKWNKIIYGDEDAEGFDFKMNLSNKPFGRAATIVAPEPHRREP